MLRRAPKPRTGVIARSPKGDEAIQGVSRVALDCFAPLAMTDERHRPSVQAGSSKARSPFWRKSVQRYLETVKDRIRMFFLPPYSPEINPDELI
jgi:hypothetical protein